MSEDNWEIDIPLEVTIKRLDYEDGIISFEYDVEQVGEQLGKFILDAVTRAAKGVLNES